ncbi:MAG: spermidine synthase, partial [Candidatus Aminicenantes bacterium]|nr:spermidine synthase [Candidatus Aminicenantes bacterium]
MGLVKKGKELWFYEQLYTDTTYGFKVSKVIVPETDTGFQKLMILETDRFGRVLVLNGIVQLTEEDEGIYHEWIAHWPIFALNRPARHVLIIGGGDCGVAREVLR